MRRFAAIIPAGGSGTRFGGDKLTQRLGGKTVLEWSIDAFARRADVALVCVATSLEVAGEKVRRVEGGANRAASVLNALRSVPTEIEWVAVHDAARPLVDQGLIDRTLEAASKYGAAAPALAVGLTIKQAEGPLPAAVEKTVPRARLWAMQTPQIMRRTDLLRAYELCPLPLDDVTDDAQLLELAGMPVWLVPGEERNLKITRPMDLRLAELILDLK